LRQAIIALYEMRLPAARLDPRDGICSRAHMERQLQRLYAGETVQLHRFGEPSMLPLAYRPVELEHSLYELRGDELVPVPGWQPGCPPPREWTVPMTVPGLIG
jgi:hypothetical protein